MTVPHKPLLPAVLSTLERAQSSFTITISTFIPSCFARSAAIPKFNLVELTHMVKKHPKGLHINL